MEDDMRLGLYFYGNVPDVGVSDYNIAIADDAGELLTCPSDEAYAHLLMPKKQIEDMAKKVLGDNFALVDTDTILKCLVLKVASGTSTGDRRFDFRSLCGWIELQDFN